MIPILPEPWWDLLGKTGDLGVSPREMKSKTGWDHYLQTLMSRKELVKLQRWHEKRGGKHCPRVYLGWKIKGGF